MTNVEHERQKRCIDRRLASIYRRSASAVVQRGLQARKLTRRVKDSTAQMLSEIRSGRYG